MNKLSVAFVVAATVAYLYMPNQQSVSLFQNVNESDIEKAFIDFIAKYGRSYASKTELPARYEAFKQNYLTIQNHNSKGSKHIFSLAIN